MQGSPSPLPSYAPVTVTLDLENHLGSDHSPRYEAPTRRLLALLQAHDVRATVFVVGKLARSNPDLVREISKAGHEIGYHSHCHRPLPEDNPERFRNETAADKAFLEDLTGRLVSGYRAPVFSLTLKSLWALDEIRNLGFAYSSSILPASSPLYGFPGAPTDPFRWNNELLELPSPVCQFLGMTVPFLGGFYLRYLPERVIRRAHGRLPGTSAVPWSYIHPYDFDTDEPFHRMAGTALWVSLMLWFNRRGAASKFEHLFFGANGLGVGPPLAERARDLEISQLSLFDPTGIF